MNFKEIRKQYRLLRCGILTCLAGLAVSTGSPLSAQTVTGYILDEMPDYDWYRGCFGTATGNFFGFWDRHGMPDFYTGPVNSGLAPLLDDPALLMRKFWASDLHDRDYWVLYETSANDPYFSNGWEEHEPDCIGDFIGLNQKKWTDLNGECAGNIDGYSFVYWDADGDARMNYSPPNGITDIQSGLRNFVHHCGYEADVMTQYTDFNPNSAPGKGFTYTDVMHEIHNGRPVMVFLQQFNTFSRPIGTMPNANPLIHGINIFGYELLDWGDGLTEAFVFVRTSWASGMERLAWDSGSWLAGLPARGVIAMHPHPKITHMNVADEAITLDWEGPSSKLVNLLSGKTNVVSRYVVEHSSTMVPGSFSTVAGPTTSRQATIPLQGAAVGFYRVSLLEESAP